RALQRDMASFHAELSILSRLRHKNIVRLYGGCMRPPYIFLVMQLMRQSLDSVIHHAEQPLKLRKALQIARDVAAGLSYLHPTIVHRDLKPANILIDEHGTAKLSDFGLARYKFKAYLSTRTPDQGSVAYMAPECFNTDIGGLGPKTDIYSFGVLLWELLSGEYPWMGESNVQIIYKVAIKGERLPLPPADGTPFVASAFTGVSSYRSSSSAGSGNAPALVVPAAIRDLMDGCFAHQPNDRPDTHTAVCILDTVLMDLDNGKLVVQRPTNSSLRGNGCGDAGGLSLDADVGDGRHVCTAEGGRQIAGGSGGGSPTRGGAIAVVLGIDPGLGARSTASQVGGSGPGDSAQGSAPVTGVTASSACSVNSREPAITTGECLMAPGNQQQLATPFSNLDFLMH
ncbi:hypothetical protein VaNZ11_005024, partial [Volvox africanus]